MKKLLLFTLALICTISVWSADVAKNVTTGTSYSSLQAAISAASANDEIQLLSNITISPNATGDYGGTAGNDYYVSGLKITKNLTIDFNGKKITASAPSASCYLFTIKATKVTFTSNNGVATINGGYKDYSSGRGTGYWGLIVPQSSSEVSISNIEFSNGRDNPCIKFEGNSFGVVDGCSFTSNSYRGGGVSSASSPTGTNKVIVRNCTADMKGYYSGNSAVISAQSSGKITVESGTYTSKAACLLIMSSGGTITVDGGTFTNTSDLKPAAFKNSTCNYTGAIFCYCNTANKTSTVITNGGTYNGYVYEGAGAGNVNLTVSGGTFSDNDIYCTTGAETTAVIKPSTTTSVSKKATASGNVSYTEDIAGVISTKVVAPADKLGDYVRNVTSGNWGTIALSSKAVVTGATLYKIINKASDGSYIELEEVEASSVLPADMPFIYQASGTQLKANYSEETAIAAVANGLVASPAAGMNWPAKAEDYTDLTGKYLIANEGGNGKLVLAANGSALAPYRAYVDMSNIEDLTATPVQGRRIIFGQNGTTVATAIDAVSAESAKAEKVMLNGKLYIRRGAQLFDAQGALVK